MALMFCMSGICPKWNPTNKEVPFSGALSGAAAPGAFGTENFANETGLKDVGFFTDPVRV